MNSNKSYTESNGNGTNGSSTKAMGKSFGKIVIGLIIGALVGGVLGFGSNFLGDLGVIQSLNELYGRFVNAIVYVQVGVFLVVIAAALWFYVRAGKLVSSEEDDMQEKAGELLNYVLLFISAGIALVFLLFGLSADARNPHFPASIIVFLVTAVLHTVMEVLVVYRVKKSDPLKKGDPADLHFAKDWVNSCDEAEKMITYRAGYDTFIVMKNVLLFANVAALIGKVSFGTGNFPIVLTCVLWLIHSLVYCIRSIQIEKTGLNQ